MMKTPLLLFILTTALVAERPNIVLVMADDLGVASLNAYGAPGNLVRTPQLNRLAAAGMRFNDASTPAAVCSPTRYALLTGEYAWRGKLKFGVVNVTDPLLIPTSKATLPRALQQLGYRTAQVGKWHLGYGDKSPPDYTERLSPGPNDLGFDYHFGLPQNLDDLLRVWIENDGVYGLRSKRISSYAKSFYGRQYMGLDAPQRSRELATEEMTDRAIEWIKRTHRGDPDRPFFLYFALAATHHPIVPSEAMRGASGAGAYGDFIQDADMSVGRLIDALEYEGIAGNTLIVFTSDNGGDIPYYDENRPEMQARNAGLLANGNLRGDKHTIHEGGVRVPLLMRWDNHITTGTTSDHRVNVVDLFATLVEAAGAPVPSPADAPDSISFWGTALGNTQAERPPSVTSNAAGVHAIRSGEWKYVDPAFPEGAPEQMMKQFADEAQPALYNLKNDPAETTNLLTQHPEVVSQLREKLAALRKSSTRS